MAATMQTFWTVFEPARLSVRLAFGWLKASPRDTCAQARTYMKSLLHDEHLRRFSGSTQLLHSILNPDPCDSVMRVVSSNSLLDVGSQLLQVCFVRHGVVSVSIVYCEVKMLVISLTCWLQGILEAT